MYCLYGEHAITGDDANEAWLQHCPVEGDWSVSLPCPKRDLEWVNRALASKSDRITARDLSERLGSDNAEDATEKAAAEAEVDMEAFLRS